MVQFSIRMHMHLGNLAVRPFPSPCNGLAELADMQRLLLPLGFISVCLWPVAAKGCPSCKPDMANEMTFTFGCSLLTSYLPSAGICRQAGLRMRQAVVKQFQWPHVSCRKDLFQWNRAGFWESSSVSGHSPSWCDAWVPGSAFHLPCLSLSACSQTSCSCGTGFAEPKGSSPWGRTASRHHMRGSPCPKGELPLRLDGCRRPRPQPSSITSR